MINLFLEHKVLDCIMSNKREDCYICFCEDKCLYEVDLKTEDTKNTEHIKNIEHVKNTEDIKNIEHIKHTKHIKNAGCIKKIAALSNIELLDKPIKLYYYAPYICVTERFGTHAAVVHHINGSIYELTREDYHADVSSYSIGFIEHFGTVCLLHQTQWNRLDLLDLTTMEIVTKREIRYEKIKDSYQTEDGKIIAAVYENENFLDYFHSLLEVSPNKTGFITNGWHWAPADNIKYSHINEFLTRYETGLKGIDYVMGGYNWDRPCAFIDETTFVIAADLEQEIVEEIIEQNSDQPIIYDQLIFYKFTETEDSAYHPVKKIAISVFPINQYGEVFGKLYYDKEKDCLITISEKGAYSVSLEGSILKKYDEISPKSEVKISNCNAGISFQLPWSYSTVFHKFYRFNEELHNIEVIDG